jgi:cytosolic carboxypeptidase protein 6
MKLLPIFLAVMLFTADVFPQQEVFQGQPPVERVDTTSRPIERQIRKATVFSEDGVTFSNDFNGARMNSVTRTGTNSYVISIDPENAPINMSPWYAFQVWGRRSAEISVTLVYPDFARHRYSPLISTNGEKWKPLDKERISDIEPGSGRFGPESRPKGVELRLKIGRKPIWISAQELNTSAQVFRWMDERARKHRLRIEEIGKSVEGRPIRMMAFGNLQSRNNILIISRQHPPEVTGYFAMQAFVDSLLSNSRLAKDFRKDWAIFVMPLINPDGVDNGHWRHNAGGIDLNRDWTAFNQPETKAVSDFINRRKQENGGRFYFGIDFHSTWDDIYYPMAPGFNSHMPGLMEEWLDSLKAGLPGYNPNIRPNSRLEPAIVSRNYFLASHGMEAIVYEIGDNTTRDFIKKKGKVGADQLMRLLMERKKGN